MKIKPTAIVISFVIISSLLLSGCNTAQGFGEDVEQGGKAIQRAATQNNNNNNN